MLQNEVCKTKKQYLLPEGRCAIGTKWIFKEKKSGIFKAWLVAKGYDQVARIIYFYNFAQVMNNMPLNNIDSENER